MGSPTKDSGATSSVPDDADQPPSQVDPTGAPAASPDEGAGAPVPDDTAPATFPSTPEEPTGPALPPGSDGGGTRALAWLLGASPFTDLHRHAGGEHPFREQLCFAVDFLLRLFVAALLLGIITAVAWKTLAPLQPLWLDQPDPSVTTGQE